MLAAPLLDLIDISGYVYLLSDYHDVPLLKDPIVKQWDTYLSEGAENQRLQLLATAVVLTEESTFEIAHRGTLRSSWKLNIQRLLRDVQCEEILDPYRRTIPIHKSPLVRVFVKHLDSLFYDGIDIFIAKYIRQREDGENLDFGWKRRGNLEEELRIEENQEIMDE